MSSRDLKPDNILIRPQWPPIPKQQNGWCLPPIAADGHVKLTDFGISDVGLQALVQPFTDAGDVPMLGPSISVDVTAPSAAHPISSVCRGAIFYFRIFYALLHCRWQPPAPVIAVIPLYLCILKQVLVMAVPRLGLL